MQKRTTIFRASAMLGAVSAVVVGATFALDTTTATLTANQVTSATASLLVDGPDEGSVPTASEQGFSFTNLLPGAVNYSAAQSFTLKNAGTSDLSVAVGAVTTDVTGSLDPTKVHLKITNTSETSVAVEKTLAELVSGAVNLPGSSNPEKLDADDPETGPDEGEADTFTVQVKLDDGASSNITGFNLVFTGTAVEES